MASSSQHNYEIISPYIFLKTLSTVASNRMPKDLTDYCAKSGFKPWNLLEEGVFFFFRQILMLHTIKLGDNTLFEHEPEGIVLWDRCGTKHAFLYECKARKDGYALSADDVLRYKDYVRIKRHDVSVKYHLPLTHFVIVSSSFRGDINRRLKEFDLEGTCLTLASANMLTRLYERTKQLEYQDLLRLHVPRLLCRGRIEIEHVTECIEAVFDRK